MSLTLINAMKSFSILIHVYLHIPFYILFYLDFYLGVNVSFIYFFSFVVL